MILDCFDVSTGVSSIAIYSVWLSADWLAGVVLSNMSSRETRPVQLHSNSIVGVASASVSMARRRVIRYQTLTHTHTVTHTLYKRLRRMSELHALVRYFAVMFYNDLSFVYLCVCIYQLLIVHKFLYHTNKLPVAFCDYFTLNHSFHNYPTWTRNDLHSTRGKNLQSLRLKQVHYGIRNLLN